MDEATDILAKYHGGSLGREHPVVKLEIEEFNKSIEVEKV